MDIDTERHTVLNRHISKGMGSFSVFTGYCSYSSTRERKETRKSCDFNSMLSNRKASRCFKMAGKPHFVVIFKLGFFLDCWFFYINLVS